MNRREFNITLGVAALGFCANRPGVPAKSVIQPRVAVTMDDFHWNQSLRLTPQQRNRAILDALKAHGDLKAALFVAGKNADSEAGKALLGEWDRAGHMMGNHSYSHPSLNSEKVTASAFIADIQKAEEVLKNFPRFQKSFRFPYLKEGESAAERDAVRAFLKQNGYRNGHVTIDASDWAVDNRLTKRLQTDPAADLTPYRKFYLAHMWERSAYYDDLSRKVLGRRVPHTVLIHFNLLNALFLGDLLDMYRRKGWRLIDAVEAFKDPLFASEPTNVPAGESIIWALAKQSGRFDSLLRYPAEDVEYENAKMDQMGL